MIVWDSSWHVVGIVLEQLVFYQYQKNMNKCLYCYKSLDSGADFHEKCCLKFFGSERAPVLSYTIDQMADLAKDVVERSVTVPGVQAKLSMSLIKETQETSDGRLTAVGALGGGYI
jgi:serine/threonine-protein kinase HipA